MEETFSIMDLFRNNKKKKEKTNNTVKFREENIIYRRILNLLGII